MAFTSISPIAVPNAVTATSIPPHARTVYPKRTLTPCAGKWIVFRLGGSTPLRPDTLYFGGGTPSLLTPAQAARLIRAAGPAPGAEITLEANPRPSRPSDWPRSAGPV